MPELSDGKIEFIPADRYIIDEQSAGITASTYTTLFNGAIREGRTMQYFKFLEEIYEKDSDINHAINTRSSQITSKEWQILNEAGEEDETSEKIKQALKDIKGNPKEGLLSFKQLLDAFLGVSYLTGISVNEIVTDAERIIGFNHIPPHFLTYENRVFYPSLYTQKVPTGVDFNSEKMIIHQLSYGRDPARGWLGNAISWQYILKRTALEERLRYQTKYGKGFLLVNMEGDKDSYAKAWETAEELIENLDDVNGAVFPSDVDAEFVEGSKLNGDYFFKADEDFKRNIVKIILGQESTSSSQDSNRSTADVHKDILETRVLNDMELIQDTLNSQLIGKIKPLIGLSDDDNYEFNFVMGELEATMDDEMEEEVINNEGNSNDNTEDRRQSQEDE